VDGMWKVGAGQRVSWWRLMLWKGSIQAFKVEKLGGREIVCLSTHRVYADRRSRSYGSVSAVSDFPCNARDGHS
jgi:hypothetical protein